jgi:hypothetical protein
LSGGLLSHIGLASGTNFARGGPTLVGERGPEIVNMPRGASVTNATKTRQALGGGGGNVTVVVTGNTILGREPQVARELARLISPHIGRVVTVGV